jgi:hypothetical protein
LITATATRSYDGTSARGDLLGGEQFRISLKSNYDFPLFQPPNDLLTPHAEQEDNSADPRVPEQLVEETNLTFNNFSCSLQTVTVELESDDAWQQKKHDKQKRQQFSIL